MSNDDALRMDTPFEALDERTMHLCIDMQRLFSEGVWKAPWAEKVLPTVVRIASAKPRNNIFTRFVPPVRPELAPGRWRQFYERWREVCTDRLDPGMLDLVPALAPFALSGKVIDKRGYSPFFETGLIELLRRREAETLVITGAETDVCVLSAVMDAVDHGLRVVLVQDALCSANDETHDALMTLYRQRFSHQLDLVDADTVLAAWR